MEYFAYAAFILVLAAPFVVAAGLMAVLLAGFRKLFSAIRNEGRIDLPGLALFIAGLVGATLAWQWLRGPQAQLATLQPLVVDRQLAANLPRTWVFDQGAGFAAIDLLPHKYADRVLNARIGNSRLRASIPEGQRDGFMEEIKLVDSPACNALLASGSRDASRTLECVTHVAVSKADIEASGPYLTLSSDTFQDAQLVNYALIADHVSRPIARCVGRAPVEANGLLVLIRGNRSNEVAASMYKCKMRAASGGLSHVIATGAMG
jgi:hypothetical protein